MTNIQKIIATSDASDIRGIKLTVPALFHRADFQRYIESAPVTATRDHGKPLTEDDYVDVVVYVDPSLTGEGSDSEMPGWDHIVDKLRAKFGPGPFSGNHFVVVLSNS